MTSTTVKVNRALSVPPVPFDLPLVDNPNVSVNIAAPSAHIGPAPVQMRLISYDLREGQVIQTNTTTLYTLTSGITTFLFATAFFYQICALVYVLFYPRRLLCYTSLLKVRLLSFRSYYLRVIVKKPYCPPSAMS